VALTIVIHFAATTNYMFYSEKESNMIWFLNQITIF
jgi:hypothetical protein